MQKNWLRNLAWSPDGAGGGPAAVDPTAAFAKAAAAQGAKPPAEPTPPAGAMAGELSEGEGDLDFGGLEPSKTEPAATEAPAKLPEVKEKPAARTKLPDIKEKPKAPQVKPPEAAKVETPAVEPVVAGTTGAPFSDAQDAIFTNKMSKEAVAHFSKRITELSEKASKVVDPKETFFNHPEGYRLLPEFNESVTVYGQLAAEQNHWQQALVAIEEGKPFKLFDGFDEQGNPIVGPQLYKPSAEAKVQIQQALNKLAVDMTGERSKIAELKKGFTGRIDEANKVINDERVKRFPWVRDEKLLSEEIEIKDYGKAPIKKVREDFLQLIPPVWRTHPLASATADMFIAMQMMVMKLNKQASASAESRFVEPVPPTPGGSTKSSAKEDEFDDEGFPH